MREGNVDRGANAKHKRKCWWSNQGSKDYDQQMKKQTPQPSLTNPYIPNSEFERLTEVEELASNWIDHKDKGMLRRMKWVMDLSQQNKKASCPPNRVLKQVDGKTPVGQQWSNVLTGSVPNDGNKVGNGRETMKENNRSQSWHKHHWSKCSRRADIAEWERCW